MSSVYWKGCVEGAGGMPSWPAATCWFWPWSAFTTSVVVSERSQRGTARRRSAFTRARISGTENGFTT